MAPDVAADAAAARPGEPAAGAVAPMPAGPDQDTAPGPVLPVRPAGHRSDDGAKGGAQQHAPPVPSPTPSPVPRGAA